MGIKHKATVSSGDKLYATDWNDEHVIESDIDFAGFSGINVGEPVNASDIATKNYVDGQAAGGGVLRRSFIYNASYEESSSGGWIVIPNGAFSILGDVLITNISVEAELYEDSQFDDMRAHLELRASNSQIEELTLDGEGFFIYGLDASYNPIHYSLLSTHGGWKGVRINKPVKLRTYQDTTFELWFNYQQWSGSNGGVRNVRVEIEYVENFSDEEIYLV